MRIWALVSWHQEDPVHLREMVLSLAPLVDGVIGLQGPYALYPDATCSQVERWAIQTACDDHNLECHLHPFTGRWTGEVEKRAEMFSYANTFAAPGTDWFLIMDGDMLLDPGVNAEAAREVLAATDRDVAEVTFAELAYGSSTHTVHATGFRSIFRAIPGLTVEGTHWLYTVPDDSKPSGRRFLWHGITKDGNVREWEHPPEPAASVLESVCLLHRPHVRAHVRVKRREDYYQSREQAVVERVPTSWD